MALTPLPTPPSSADPVNFNTRADAFLLAMQNMVAEINAGAFPVPGGTMTANLGILPGLVGAPGMFISGDTNTGIWAPAADTLASTSGGVEVWRQTASLMTVAKPLTVNGLLTSSLAGNAQFLAASTSSVGTGYFYGLIGNTGGALAFGVENSTGSSLAAGAPAYASTLTSNNATSLVLGTNQTAKLTIASGAIAVTQNATGFGIGINPSNFVDASLGINGAATMQIANGSGGVTASARMLASNTTYYGGIFMWGTAFSSSGINRQNGMLLETSGIGGMTLNVAAAQPMYFAINNSEVARFDSSGNLLIGNTNSNARLYVSQNSSSIPVADFQQNNGSGVGAYFINNANTGTMTHIDFFVNSGGSLVGSITSTTTATAFNTSSGLTKDDGRINKTMVEDIDPALAWDVLDAFAPKSFFMSADDKRSFGFVVNTGHKTLASKGRDLQHMGLYVPPDEDDNGGAMDYGKMTPFLGAATLDLRSQVRDIQARLARANL